MRFRLMTCIAVLSLLQLGCDRGHGHSHDTATPASTPESKPDHHPSID